MKQEKQQAIALMRYGAIAPLIAGLDEDYQARPLFTWNYPPKDLSDRMAACITMHPQPSKNGIWIIRTTGLMPLSRKDALMQV